MYTILYFSDLSKNLNLQWVPIVTPLEVYGPIRMIMNKMLSAPKMHFDHKLHFLNEMPSRKLGSILELEQSRHQNRIKQSMNGENGFFHKIICGEISFSQVWVEMASSSCWMSWAAHSKCFNHTNPNRNSSKLRDQLQIHIKYRCNDSSWHSW